MEKGELKQWLIVFLSELIGTAMLVYFGCSGLAWTDLLSNSILQLSVVFGLVIAGIVHCFAGTSGAHINPAVSVAAYIMQVISLKKLIVYFVAQMLGGILGYALVKLCISSDVIEHGAHNLCVNHVADDIKNYQALGIEFMTTSGLVLLVCAVWDPRNRERTEAASLIIGLAITVLASVSATFSTACLNPARAFGPSLLNLDFPDHWVFWIGPLSGGAFAALLYRFLLLEKSEQKSNE